MEGALRTTHPTSSVIAVGKEKALISKFHYYNSFSYDFMKPLIDKNAKMLNIDCDISSILNLKKFKLNLTRNENN